MLYSGENWKWKTYCEYRRFWTVCFVWNFMGRNICTEGRAIRETLPNRKRFCSPEKFPYNSGCVSLLTSCMSLRVWVRDCCSRFGYRTRSWQNGAWTASTSEKREGRGGEGTEEKEVKRTKDRHEEGQNKKSPNVGLEPTTLGLRVPCSTDWANQAGWVM